MKSLLNGVDNMSVHRKLMLAILMSGTVTMVFAGLAMFLFLMSGLRKNFENDAQALTRIVAANAAGPVHSDDRAAAVEILISLLLNERVVGAVITLPQGQRFVEIGTVDERWLVMLNEPQTRWASRDQLVLLCPVKLEGKQVATFALVSDFGPVYRQFLQSYLLVFAVVLVGAGALSHALTARARRMISAPIRELARTANLVARTQNFELRMRRMTGGEIGQLTDAFNDMLQRLKVGEAVAREVEERRRVEAALRESEQRFRTVFDNATIGLFRANREGLFLMANPALVQMVGHDSFAELAGVNLSGHLYADPQCREQIMEYLEQVGMVSEAEVVWRRRDGTLITVQQSIKAIRDEAGNILHFEGCVEDVTARKIAEAELQRLHRELVDASRAAGMAEVATGVLHNVGNVLNSVNVSVTLLSDQVAASKVASLKQAIGLLEANLDQLGSYLAEDPKGRLVPGFLIKVAEHMAGEQAQWQTELGHLRANVQHIKEVVAMQQSHARVVGFIEPHSATAMLEEVLRNNQRELEAAGFEIERDYQPVPAVLADRHKVLPILNNLIRNAKDAVDELSSTPPKMALKVYRNGSGRVKIQIRDFGIGIPQENITQIFAHGFTTRPDGHGFGLHIGALAARELGGELMAESDGLGCGATFTLELPAANAGN